MSTEPQPGPRPQPSPEAEQRSLAAFAEQFCAEDELLNAAAERAQDLGAAFLPFPAAQLLTCLTTSLQPLSVLEIGSGAGVSSAAIARALSPLASMTLIDPDSEYLRAARSSIAATGFPVHRVRSIASPAQEVLGRFSTGGYDFVLIDAGPAASAQCLAASLRLVRPGGLLVLADPLNGGRAADPGDLSETSLSARQGIEQLRKDARFTSSLIPVGPGMLLASKKQRH